MPCDPETYKRRLETWWRAKAEGALEDLRPRTPPTGWAFVSTLQAFLRFRPLDAQIKYDEGEATDWRSFRAWYRGVSEDLHKIVELLEDHRRWPCDPELEQQLLDRGYELKDAYRNWLDRGAIKWIPEDHALKTVRGREPCTVVEFVAEALLALDKPLVRA